jgi:signal peptidase I
MTDSTDDPRYPSPARPEPVPVPEPEPLVPTEPAPFSVTPTSDPGELYGSSWDAQQQMSEPRDSVTGEPLEHSWRQIVGAPRDETPRPPQPLPDQDTSIGTLGDEPMGGVPREQPAGEGDANPSDANAARLELQHGPLSRVDPHPSVMSRVGEELLAWLKTLASAAVYATLIVTFGFQVARVEGQSMAPTLADQDRLIVNKLAYRIGAPQVGDIVMLYYPLNPDKSFVKRVIAEEGDQIRIVDGRVYRNDVAINDDYVPAEFRSHDDYGPQVVPQGYYFVMGDHRNNSSDSRHWGYVPKKYIIGKVQLRWWPIPHALLF